MTEPHEVLNKYADDSEVSIHSCSQDELVLHLKMASHGGQTWLIKCRNLVHLDLSPLFILGHLDCGGIELLPEKYLTSRNRGYEGDEEKYRVLRFTDIDDNTHFVLSYETEEIVVATEAT